MEWAKATAESLRSLFGAVGIGPAAVPVAFMLGLVSAVASACCTMPVLAAIVAYSGSRGATAGALTC